LDFFASFQQNGVIIRIPSEGEVVEEEEKAAIRKASEALQKDPDGAFAPFYDLTKKRVYFLIYSYVKDYAESEDLLQDTYVTFLENLHKISCRLNPLSYLLQIAKNKAIDYLRKLRPEVELDKEDTSELVGSADPPKDEAGTLLEEIRSLLSPFEFQVYTLHVLSGLTFKEISGIVHRPIGTLTYTYSETIDKLKKGVNPLWMSNSKKT
jgi:RNA polymerase sigma factor (sigma-70 family)